MGQSLGQPLQGHAGMVLSVSFSQDGTRIASGSQDNTVRLWDAATGQSSGEPLQGHAGMVLSVSFSPDGTRIASSSWDNTIRLWDAAFGQTCHDNTETNSSSFPPHTSRTTPRAQQHPIMSPITWNHHLISFSSDFKSERALCNSADLLEGISHHYSNLTPLSLQADGWVMGPNRQLLFWIPPASQHAICTPWTLWVIPRGAELDLSRMAHGTRWSSCRNALGYALFWRLVVVVFRYNIIDYKHRAFYNLVFYVTRHQPGAQEQYLPAITIPEEITQKITRVPSINRSPKSTTAHRSIVYAVRDHAVHYIGDSGIVP
ncbi:uncharacterized protein HD556DRAFT_1539570 [Suillus plorans]|uniref:WD40 repeat-like protein n=1 Tax=Suillus plorans TaxID=116603 RepID=A0A9P7DC55_9AGAM|nr:uncharacterized protein HD556DRAFT_1539570 [Suillus plorans]KAG1786433.1 hypothetical protein HD556DRAFT_1539570 [Suillus plorans]